MTARQVEAELPAVYLDALVVETAAARLQLVNREPEPDEAGVPLATPVALSIVDVGAVPGIAGASVRVYVDGALAYDGALGGFQPGWDGPASASTTPASNTRRLVLDHLDAFASLAVVAVRVVAATADGAYALDVTYAFTCADVTAPRVVAAQATGHRTLRLAFDETMGAGVRDAASYALTRLTTPAVAPVVTAVEAGAGTSYVLTLDRDLTPGALYELTVTGARDVTGNAVAAPFNVASVTGYACAVPQGRAFALWDWLPDKNRREDDEGTGDLRRFLACLQEVTDLLLCDVDRWGDILDPDFAPEWAVDNMLGDLGNPFAFELSLDDKRRLVRVLVPLYKQKGTAPGIVNAVRFFLGFDIEVLAYSGEGLVLGESTLGETWVLASDGRRARYSFDVRVGRVLSSVERARLRAVVNYMKRVGTHLVKIVEPIPVVEPDHAEIGLSALSDTFALH